MSGKSTTQLASEYNIWHSAVARIFQRVNGEFPVLYRSLLARINFKGNSIKDLRSPVVQSELTLYK